MKPSSIWMLAAALLCASGLAPAGAADARPDLTGQITETDGSPIGGASVFIYSAGPKQGTSSLCPSCYPDCQKKTQADAGGRFIIESLDSSLLFRVLVVAAGHESKLVSKVDPEKGSQKISLKPVSEASLHSSLRVKGAVINESGQPVAGAIISPEGVGLGASTRWGGNDQMVEPLAVADAAGHFVLFCKTNSMDAIYATAEGRGVAKQWVTLKPGGDYLIKLPVGVTLAGQVVRDGQPLSGVAIAAATKDHRCGVYFHCDATFTDSNGRFLLLNVPPNREFVVYGTMKSLAGSGVLPVKDVTTGDSGLVQDLGQLVIQPAFSIAGQIVLSDGQPVPPGTRLFCGREAAMDSVETQLDAAGKFVIKGVPAESVSLSIRIKGYRLSKRNPSLDWLNGSILGRVDSDVKAFTILMEPGEWERNRDDDRPGGNDDYPVNKPLRCLKL
jgi:hypothetical protein